MPGRKGETSLTSLLRSELRIDDLLDQLHGLGRRLDHLEAAPLRAWWTLKEACAWKGVCYNTVKSSHALQPNGGRKDARIGGRRMWRRETVESWLNEVDP